MTYIFYKKTKKLLPYIQVRVVTLVSLFKRLQLSLWFPCLQERLFNLGVSYHILNTCGEFTAWIKFKAKITECDDVMKHTLEVTAGV